MSAGRHWVPTRLGSVGQSSLQPVVVAVDPSPVDPPRTVMEIVGHATLEMTMNVYAHVTLDDKRAALGRLRALLDGEAAGERCCHRKLSGRLTIDCSGHFRWWRWRARRDSNPQPLDP